MQKILTNTKVIGSYVYVAILILKKADPQIAPSKINKNIS